MHEIYPSSIVMLEDSMAAICLKSHEAAFADMVLPITCSPDIASFIMAHRLGLIDKNVPRLFTSIHLLIKLLSLNESWHVAGIVLHLIDDPALQLELTESERDHLDGIAEITVTNLDGAPGECITHHLHVMEAVALGYIANFPIHVTAGVAEHFRSKDEFFGDPDSLQEFDEEILQ